ncbi:MAG: hypothetical protein ACWA5P_01855 [bacterium]
MIITTHAYGRAKERLSWKKPTLERMAERALLNGKTHAQSRGRLKKYIDKLWFKNKTANNIKIYGQNLYIFHGSTLITLYRLPNNLITKNRK